MSTEDLEQRDKGWRLPGGTPSLSEVHRTIPEPEGLLVRAAAK